MYLYILYSPDLKHYYKGVSEDPERRLTEHNQGIKKSAYTAITNDWELIFKLKCESREQALKVERYLKKSANVNYLRRFISEEKLRETILERFK